jgi:Ca2+-transporting ATPase
MNRLSSSPQNEPINGLTKTEALQRKKQFGPNQLPEPPIPGVISIFAKQFLSPFIYILLLAAIVSLFLQQIPNAVFILAVLLLNAVIGTIQEYSAQKSAAALRNMVRGQAHVLRDGKPQIISVEDVVPGDIILLSSGDKVPADLYLYSCTDLSVDESMLTGESLSVMKIPGDLQSLPIAQEINTKPLAERNEECFAGTIVTRGRAQGIVLNTGLQTELGKIAGQVTADQMSEPPLLIRIRHFTYQLAAAIFIAIMLLIALMFAQGGYDYTSMAMMAIGLAVSVIPEGLPAALTVALAIGMRRMAALNVIIRKLVAVETLGSCTFICSDKTGTLTVNELTIRQLLLPNGDNFSVSGEGVAPGGEITNSKGDPVDCNYHRDIVDLCTTGLLANESHLDYAGGDWVSDGDIVDVAFLVLAKKLGISLNKTHTLGPEVELIPYESENAFSGSLNKHDQGLTLHVKGSPEKLLSMCNTMRIDGTSIPIDRSAIEQQFNQQATKGYRIIALARRSVAEGSAQENLSNMEFIGMAAMIDPIRPEAKYAIEKCQKGGIQVAMVTGDHPATAKAIALELGLCEEDATVTSGPMLHAATQKGSKHADDLIRPCRVFARIEPQQKQQIVESLMRAGHFVAVTGDGVNDAPAMRQSHAGVAMGKRGTDVARETADLILTDDNFASIVSGIEQGRIVYNNIRKVIGLLVATGLSAILLFFLSVAAGLPMPLLPLQLLWLNLVANGLQDVALAVEPGEGGELDAKPRKPNEPIFDRHIIEHVLVTGTLMGGLAFLVFFYMNSNGFELDDSRNLTLMLMVLFGNIHALSSRSETRSIFHIRFWANPFLVLAVPFAQGIHILAMYTPGLSQLLELHVVTLREWGLLAAISLLLLLAEEIHKWFLRRRKKHFPAIRSINI